MKITQFRKNGDTTALSVMDLEKLVNNTQYLQPIITQYFASNKSEIWP